MCHQPPDPNQSLDLHISKERGVRREGGGRGNAMIVPRVWYVVQHCSGAMGRLLLLVLLSQRNSLRYEYKCRVALMKTGRRTQKKATKQREEVNY